ncbi:MAG: complex I NDUFA9 subunit family protein [Candidatus Zixiibacteriota bacterium]|nr:MAG: complex I NDUFA9 subunit family protein [candidate division Zixibacteria bacterium]
MKVAVTGGTGFVGRNLVNRLVAEDHQVTVLTHSDTGEGLFAGPVRTVAGSVDDALSLEAAFGGADVVYHLVGIIAETKHKTFERTVVVGTTNVVEACRRAGIEKLLYLSAMGTSHNARTEYHRTKYLAEQAVIKSGMEYVIYRPSVIYGLDDGFVSLLVRLITKSPITPVIGNGHYRLQPVYIDDVVSAMVQALTVQQANERIIEIGGPEKLEYLEILHIIKRVLGKKRVNFHIPMWVMRAVASVMEKLMKPAPITRDQLKMMATGNTGDITLMKQLFAIDPVPFEKGLRKYLR